MHINDTHHNQAIALLHEVCDALGIDQEDRTREEIRKRLESLCGKSKPSAMTRKMAVEIGRLQQDWLTTLGDDIDDCLNHDKVEIVTLERQDQPNVLTLQLLIYGEPVSELAIDLTTMAASERRVRK